MKKPGIVTRAKAAYSFFRHGWQQFDLKKSGSPFIWPTWRNNEPRWPTFDYSSYAQEGFNENAVVYGAIMYKVRALTAAPLRAYTINEEGQAELLPREHPLTQLVTRPNQYQSWSEFQGLADVYLNLGGNCYVVYDRETPALYLLRPDRVYPVPYPDSSKKALMGFLYVPEGLGQRDGVPYLSQDVMHIRLPNPLDEMDGMGRGNPSLGPAARSTAVDNQVTRYLKLFFDQGAMPPGLLKYKMALDDSDVKRAKTRWREAYGGVDNWTDILILDQEGEYQRLGLSFDEMGFGPLDERNEARMCCVFGVPPILIGTRLGLTRASYGKAYEEARRAFWQDTMLPEIRMFETEYQHFLNTAREFVAFDLAQVPALSLTETEKQEAARDAFRAGGITRNDYRAALNLAPMPGGDIFVLPTNMAEMPAMIKSTHRLSPFPEEIKREIMIAVQDAGREALKERRTITWIKSQMKILPLIPLENVAIVRDLFLRASEEGWSVETMEKHLKKELWDDNC